MGGKAMNWEAIGAVGEIVGAIAVIATLIYLAVQIKESAQASRSAAVTDATTPMLSFYQELGSNPQTSELFLEGMTNPDSLSRHAQYQFIMLTHFAFLGFQRCFFLAQEGTLDVGIRDSIGTAVHAVNQMPGMYFYWRQRKSYFQPEFVRWIEDLLAREPLTDMDVYQRRDGAPPE
jgi:hypothetical protein